MPTPSYIVIRRNSLGYVFAETPNTANVLSSNVDGHDPKNGPVAISRRDIRPATLADFARFRVMPPPDFV